MRTRVSIERRRHSVDVTQLFTIAMILAFLETAAAEGTSQLGVNQDLIVDAFSVGGVDRSDTVLSVDIETAGEVINIFINSGHRHR